MLDLMRATSEFFSAPSGTLALVALLVGLGQIAVSHADWRAMWIGFLVQALCAVVFTLMLLSWGWEQRELVRRFVELPHFSYITLSIGAVWILTIAWRLVLGIGRAKALKELRYLYGKGLAVNNRWENSGEWSRSWNEWQTSLNIAYKSLDRNLPQIMELNVTEAVRRMHGTTPTDLSQPYVDRAVLAKRLEDLRIFLSK